MENTFSIEGLWAYIQSLSLSEYNRKWLVSKLQEPSVKKKNLEDVEELPILSKEQLIAEILESTKQAEEGKAISADSFMEELREYIKTA